MIPVTPAITLSEGEIEEQFIHASGPGGQNVNKLATAVQLRFDAAASPALSGAILHRLRLLSGRRMTKEGVIVLTADRFRAREMNRRDALDRLIQLIRAAAVTPKRRRPTRPSRAAKRRRLDEKKHRGTLKKRRGKPSEAE